MDDIRPFKENKKIKPDQYTIFHYFAVEPTLNHEGNEVIQK